MYKLTTWVLLIENVLFSNMPYIIVMCCVGHVLSDMLLYLKMAVTYNCLYFEAFAFDVSNTTYESPFSI